MGVIVSDALPAPDKSLVMVDGVWIVSFDSAGNVAAILRKLLLEVASAYGSVARRDDLKGRVYDYLVSDEFGRRVASIVETIEHMRKDLHQEERVFQSRWIQREEHINCVIADVASVIEKLRGIGTSMPFIEALDLPERSDLELPSAG